MKTENPIYDALLAEVGPLMEDVDTEYVLLASRAVLEALR